MTKLYLAALCMLATLSSLVAQENSKKEEKGKKSGNVSMTYVSANAKLSKTHTKEELEQLGKLELTKIYMDRITILTELAPFIALHTQPGATLADMGIPATSENTEHLEKEVKNKEEYLKSVKETLDDIIPYADKGNIIWAIMFFEEMIVKIQDQK